MPLRRVPIGVYRTSNLYLISSDAVATIVTPENLSHGAMSHVRIWLCIQITSGRWARYNQ